MLKYMIHAEEQCLKNVLTIMSKRCTCPADFVIDPLDNLEVLEVVLP